MSKREKNKILKWAETLTDEELERKYYDSVFASLGSESEEMMERGYDMVDVKERLDYERYLMDKTDVLEMLCEERGIKLWE